MGTFNTQTGQYEDDAVDGALAADPGVAANASEAPPISTAPVGTSSPGVSDPSVDPRRPDMSGVLSSVADSAAGIGSAGGSAPTGATPAATPAAPAAPETPAVPPVEAPPPPEVHTMIKAPEVTKKIVNKEEIKADQEVAKATADGAAALKLDAANNLAKASIDQDKLDLEATQKKQQAIEAKARLDDANRRKAVIDDDVQAKTAAYQEAAADKNFWKTPGSGSNDPNDIHNRQNWSLSLMFGNIAEGLGGQNPGRKLLDKTMSDWVTERDKNLARLERDADKAGGLQKDFWSRFGEEAKAQKEMQDAAGYLALADKIDAMNVKMKNLIPLQAQAANAKAASDYREKAALQQQGVIDKRFEKDQVKSGGSETTTITGKPVAAGSAGEGKAAGVMIQKGTMYEKGKDALNTVDKARADGISLNEKDRQRIQQNLKEIEKSKHYGLTEDTIGRRLGIIAQSPYEGLSPRKQELAAAHDLLSQVGASVTSPSTAAEEMEHSRQIFDLNAPGQSDHARDAMTDKLRGVVGSAKKLAGKYADRAAKGAAEELAAAPNRQAPVAPSASPSGGVRQTRRAPDGSLIKGTLMTDGSFHVDG